MAIINLRDFYPYYTADSFIEVPDEVAEAMAEFDRKDSISIESQIDFCKYELKGGSCKIFKDKGYSGKNTDRPEFQKLLDEIRKGKVRRVIVYKLDRISRSILDFANMMVPDPAAADHVRLMFQMYAEPGTSFGDISRYFEENDIKVYGKSLFRPFLSQLLRNPVYAQADLELYEFFKSQGAAVVNDAADFAGTNGCYLYQGRDVKEDKDRSLKDQILVIAPHEGIVSSDTWLKCRKKLMANITFQNGRKARNTWLAGKVKCGKCGYALKVTRNPSGYEYLRCNKRSDHKGCPGCGTLRKAEFEQFIFTAMGEKFRDFKHLRGGEEKANPKLTAYQVELAQVEAEIEKRLPTYPWRPFPSSRLICCPAIWTNDWSTKQGVWHGYCRHVLRQRTLRH